MKTFNLGPRNERREMIDDWMMECHEVEAVRTWNIKE